jgi:hypothetical protein
MIYNALKTTELKVGRLYLTQFTMEDFVYDYTGHYMTPKLINRYVHCLVVSDKDQNNITSTSNDYVTLLVEGQICLLGKYDSVPFYKS